MTTESTILIDDAVIARLIQTHADESLRDSMSVTMMNEDPAGADDVATGAGSQGGDDEGGGNDQEVRIVRMNVKRRPRQKNPGTDAPGGHSSEADCSVTFELLQGSGETIESTLRDKSAVMKVVRAFDEVTLSGAGHELQFEPAESDYQSGEIADAKVTLSKIMLQFTAVRNSGTSLEAN